MPLFFLNCGDFSKYLGCSNILEFFFFQTESPLMIRPFLNDMTMSELHAVMTGGFATIAGSVLGAYISFGVSETS